MCSVLLFESQPYRRLRVVHSYIGRMTHEQSRGINYEWMNRLRCHQLERRCNTLHQVKYTCGVAVLPTQRRLQRVQTISPSFSLYYDFPLFPLPFRTLPGCRPLGSPKYTIRHLKILKSNASWRFPGLDGIEQTMCSVKRLSRKCAGQFTAYPCARLRLASPTQPMIG